jgi:outer membrane immunogenic protein
MKHAMILAVSLLALGNAPAMAADIPVKARPVVPVAAAYTWTGCYIGGSVGGKGARTSGTVDVGPTGTGVGLGAPGSIVLPGVTSSTLTLGGQLGCNWQSSNWVFGLEGDAHWQRWSRTTTLVGAQPFPFIAGDFYDIRSRWQASARGRIGYAWDRTLFYVTGGIAAAAGTFTFAPVTQRVKIETFEIMAKLNWKFI